MMRIKMKWLAWSVMGLLSATAVCAETAQETAVRHAVEPALGTGVKVDAVSKTPYAGLYEVRVGQDVLYTDEKAQYLFVGNVIDARNGTNYTRGRIDELSRIRFADLPLEAAIKTVRGNGRRVIAVFEDPNCGYCKRLRKTLVGMNDLTVYTFLYNVVSESSPALSQDIWCAPDRARAWEDWMLNGKRPPSAAASCKTPNDKVMELGRKLRIAGTPAIFFVDGTRVPGAVDAATLEAKLAAVKSPS